MTPDPLPTIYQGIRMRSPREAELAQTFDRYQVPWTYETESFPLNGTPYTPAFWLPEQDTFVEVHPDLAGISKERMQQILLLAALSAPQGRRVILMTEPWLTREGHIAGHSVMAQPVETFIRRSPLHWGLEHAPLGSQIVYVEDYNAALVRCNFCGSVWLNYGWGLSCTCPLPQGRIKGERRPQPVIERPDPGAPSRFALSSKDKLYYRFLDGEMACLGDMFTGHSMYGVFASVYDTPPDML